MPELLFNVADAGELAEQLVRVLDVAGTGTGLRERAVVRAERFRWEDMADKALDFLTRPHVPERSGVPARSARDAPRGAGSPYSRPCLRCGP